MRATKHVVGISTPSLTASAVIPKDVQLQFVIALTVSVAVVFTQANFDLNTCFFERINHFETQPTHFFLGWRD